jgi:hypothetical protein
MGDVYAPPAHVALDRLKAFREYGETQKALQLAGELTAVRQEAEKQAIAPTAKFTAAKDLMEAQVDAVKADLAHRMAYVKLMAHLGNLLVGSQRNHRPARIHPTFAMAGSTRVAENMSAAGGRGCQPKDQPPAKVSPGEDERPPSD